MSQRTVLIISVLLALAIRILFVAFRDVSQMAGHDGQAYWSFAEGIVSGQGFRSTFEPWLADRPPLYPYFLALIFVTLGKSTLIVFLVQSVLGALTAGLLALCVIRVSGSVGAGLIAGLLAAVLPHFLLFTKQILTENLYIFLFVVFLATLVLPGKDRYGPLHAAASGFVMGLLILVRREGILPSVLVFLAVVHFLTAGNWRRLLFSTAAAAGVAVLVVLPWIVRDCRELGSCTLSSSTGYNFMVGNNPDAQGGYTPPPPAWDAQLAGAGELQRDRIAWQLATTWIRENPDAFLRLLPQKVLRLFSLASNVVYDSFDIFLLCFSIIGIGVGMKNANRGVLFSIALLPIVASVAVSLVFVGGWRYRMLFYPGLIFLAASGLAWAVQRGWNWVRAHL